MTQIPPPVRSFTIRRGGILLVQAAYTSAGELYDVLAAHGCPNGAWASGLWQRNSLFDVSHAGLTVTEFVGGQ